MSGTTTPSAVIYRHTRPKTVTAGLAGRQAAIACAILDPHTAVPDGLVGPDGQPSPKRFAVYRNNVFVGLIEALKAAYPVVHCLVGEEFFTAMARLYVMGEPPVSPIMLEYGAGFPRFIEAFEPAWVLPYLADVARLERAWAEAYHASEASPVPPADLAGLPPGKIPMLRLSLHPSVRIVRSRYPVVAIWQANIGDGEDANVDLGERGDDALVTRPFAEVEVRSLPAGVATFIEALQAGASIVDAAKQGLTVSPAFDLTTALRGMVEANVIVGYDVEPFRSTEAA